MGVGVGVLTLWLTKWAPNIALFVYRSPPPRKDDSAAKDL
jgi:hypothetical protein